MKSGRSNKFSRALGHLKSTTIEEKLQLQLLSEIPTNNTQGVYTDEPERTVTTTLNPNLNPLDLTQDDPAQNGRDTSGLFMPDGTILTEEPPGDTTYILGPMAAMYYTWSYPWTMIGYIRQSDRKMVNLGRIDGKLSDWDGSVGNAGSGTGTFSSYGQLTTEQALWFRDVQKQPGATNHPSTYNYYAFYPGPPSQTPDANGRYPCVITGVSKNRTETNIQKPTQKPINPDWGLSGYMFIKNEKTGKWEKKYYRNDGTVSTERSGEMTPDNPFYDAYQRGGGDKAAENGYSRDEIIRAGNEDIQREVDQQARQEYQDYLKQLQQQGQEDQDAVNDPYGNNREYYGPAFGDDQTANSELEKIRQQDIAAIGDPYELKPQEREALKKIAKDQGGLHARNVQIELEISKLDRLEDLGALSTRQWVDRAALQGLQTYNKIGDAAAVASDVLSVLSLGVSLGSAAKSLPRVIQKAPNVIKNVAGRGMVNPLGQRMSVRSGAAGRQRVDVYRGRPYQGNLKIGGQKPAFSSTVPQTGATYTNPGAMKGVPGTGGFGSNVRVNPKGTLDRGSLPQRYIDKYGGRSVLGQQQIKMSPSAAAKTFGGKVVPGKPTRSSASTSGKPFSKFIDNVGQNTSIGRWYNQGRNVRVPNENQASISQLRADDKAQIGRFVNPKNPTNPDGSPRLTGGVLPNPTKGYQMRQFATFRGGLTRSINPFLGPGQGLRSGPTPLARQQFERPIRNMMNMTPGQKGVALGGAAAGALGASELASPRDAESGRKITPNDGISKLQKSLGPDYNLVPVKGGKGDHIRYQITKGGKPVEGGIIGGGVRGGQKGNRILSPSFESGIDRFINAQTGTGTADTGRGQAQGSTKINVKNLKPTTKGRGPKVQPRPTTRSTIKSMPARMMGKPGTVKGVMPGKPGKVKGVMPSVPPKPPAVQPVVPTPRPIVNPLQTDPYKFYNPASGLSGKAQSAVGGFRHVNPNISNMSKFIRSMPGYFRNIRNIKFDYELEGQMLIENRNRILREIKKETILPDEKKEKLKGYRPKTYGKLHAQYDTLMQKAENPASFKQMDETAWTKNDKYYNERLSQERKNEVLDHLGTGDHYWDLICETGKKSREKGLQEKYGDYTLVRKEELAGDTLLFLVDENGKKESILQSEYSDRIARQIEEPLWEQETLNAPNDPLIKRVRNKLATQIDYPDKPSPMGYPDGATPQQIAGWHPEYGKRAAYYNALDPQSADAMPLTGDPETDVKVDAQKTPLKKKTKKELKAEARLIQSDWKNEIQIPEKKLEEEVPTFRKLLDVTKERGVVSEKMTSSGMFVTSTLEPTGDDINVDISASSLRYNIGDAVVADGAIRFGEVEPNGYSSSWWNQMAGTNFVRTTTVPGEKQNTHVSFNVDVGTGIDAPLPNHPLVIEYQMQTSSGFNAGYGTLGNITSSGIHSFELPEYHEYFEISFNLEVQGTYLQTYEAAYQRRQFVGSNIYGMTITEDDVNDSLGPARMLRVILDHPGPYDDDASSSMHVFLHHTRTNGQTVYDSLNPMPSVQAGGPLGHTGADREFLFNLIRSQYAHLKDRYAKTYTINSLGMTRRTPITVFKALDDPDANVFIRMGGLENLSPEERRKKLADMLAAGDEYILNYLGIDPSTARPGNDEVAGPGYIDSDDAFDNPYYDEPFQDPGDLDDSDDESTWDYAKGDGDTEVAGTNWDLYNWMNKTYGLPAAEWKKENPTKPDSSNPHLPAGSYVPKASKKQETQVAHYEPGGDVISEKKKLKNPEELLKKIPGYYDGKPSPIVFPIEPPVKPVNGQHPELINPVKIANRFNRLDPISAKSMPLTGNPHIDKKVKAARKKPK